jgi:hypothetical protein
MSKRKHESSSGNSKHSKHHHRSEDDAEKETIISNYKQKLMELQGNLERLTAMNFIKPSDLLQISQQKEDLFQYSYVDPFVAYELQLLSTRNNVM